MQDVLTLAEHGHTLQRRYYRAGSPGPDYTFDESSVI